MVRMCRGFIANVLWDHSFPNFGSTQNSWERNLCSHRKGTNTGGCIARAQLKSRLCDEDCRKNNSFFRYSNARYPLGLLDHNFCENWFLLFNKSPVEMLFRRASAIFLHSDAIPPLSVDTLSQYTLHLDAPNPFTPLTKICIRDVFLERKRANLNISTRSWFVGLPTCNETTP